MIFRRLLLTAVGTAAVLGLAPAAQADAVADFFKGKRMQMIVGGTPGGGYDVYARNFARYYVDYIPGKPNMIVQNMQGAASIRAANYVYNVAPKDGTVLAAVQRTIPILSLYGTDGLQYDANKFNWLGSINNEVSVCVSRQDSGIATIQDAMARELIIGGSGANDTENFPAVLNNLLGTKFKIISGYKGPDIALAMERNEVSGRCGWSWTSLRNQHREWLDKGSVNVLIQLSVEKLDEIKAPLVMDMAKSDEDRQVFELVFAPQAFGRPFVLPPDVPSDRVAALRAAFNQTAKDPKLIADLEKLSFDVSLVTGERMQEIVARLLKTPPAVVQKAADSMNYRGERLQAKIVEVKDSGTVSKVIREGRAIEIKLSDGTAVESPLSASRSKVIIAGKEAARGDIKEGMACTVTYPARGMEVSSLDCK